MALLDEETRTVWMPGGDEDIASTRSARRKPSTGERWELWKAGVRLWDKRIWWFLAIVTAIFFLMGMGTWFATKVIDGFGRTQVEAAKVIAGDPAAKAQGNEAEMIRFLQAAGDPFKAWEGKCIPSSHTKTVVGVGVDRNGKPTNSLNRVRSWELVMAVQMLGPIDLQSVYVGDVNGEVLARPTMTDDTPGKLCFKPTPAASSGSAPVGTPMDGS